MRIGRINGPRAEHPLEAMVIPLHLLQNATGLAAVVAAAVGGGLLLERALGGRDEND